MRTVAAQALPTPGRQRWQPLRAGLVDLFHYDREEFWFRDGHLLLRGNNGTGKSKVMALMLPFLLDGETQPYRVEPDGDIGKRMEWNLLLGGRHAERTGYTWLEFGRIDPRGEPAYVTIGAGLRAATGRPGVQTWFFVTEQRVGDELFLVGPGRAVVPRDRLRETLGERGEVFDRAGEYRRAVDERLFHLGRPRYEALVNLLIQLRQPQLSKKPDERRLSAALTEALAPLGQALLADVAEAFRSLDEDRRELAVFSEARDTAAGFLLDYRRYAQIASRRRAAEPREAQSRYEAAGRELGAVRARQDEATVRVAEAEAARHLAERALVSSRAEEAALGDSEQMRDAKRLQRLEEDAERAAATARRSADDVRRADQRLARHQTALATARDRVNAAELDLTERSREVVEAARVATVPDLDLNAADAYQRAHVAAERRRQAVARLELLLGQTDAARRELAEARRRHGEAEQQAERAQADLEAARTGRDDAGGAFVSLAGQALGAAVEAVPGDPDPPLGLLDAWVETLQGPDPARTALEDAARAALERLAAQKARLGAERDAMVAERIDLHREQDSLQRGGTRRPPVPYTRDDAARAERAGAPLWRLVDFAEGVDDAAGAGLEAALESAGLLDAWLTPDGRLLDADDVALVTGDPVVRSIAQVLVPAVDADDAQAGTVPLSAVAAALDSVGLGPDSGASSWVAESGRWRLGAAEGRWHKPSAEYVGAGARAQARRRRLAQIARLVSELDARAARLDTAIGEVHDRSRRVGREVAAYPGDQLLRDAHARVLASVEGHRRAAERVDRLADDASVAHDRASQAIAVLAEAGRDLRLPTAGDELAAVDRALTGFVVLLPTWRAALERRTERLDALIHAESEVCEAVEGHERAVAAAEQDGRAASAKSAERDALRETAGAAVQEVQRRLARARDRIVVLDEEQAALGARLRALERELGVASGAVEELRRQLADLDEHRQACVARMRRFAGSGLLVVALPELEVPDPNSEWAPTPTVLMARRVEQELAGVDAEDRAWERASRAVTERLQGLGEALSRSGGGASYLSSDDGLLVSAQWRGREVSVPELVSGLGEELEERERLLSAREREILENHLVDQVAAELQLLIEAAERQVAQINAELAERPTSTGMTLRLVWATVDDGPAGLAAVRARLLRQDAAAWSGQDRAAVGEFLRARIAEVRARDEVGTWLEHLTEALDYRSWHRFAIQRHQDGRWRPATGPASGGERVLAATIPLFAAASSYYRSAGAEGAPRLVVLDEAFAGVDDDARAKCLGLLATFDLDYVLTSEREWGCYATVPGLSIAHLTRREGIDAVLVTSWEWDGARREQVSRALPPMQAPAARSAAEPGLFG